VKHARLPFLLAAAVLVADQLVKALILRAGPQAFPIGVIPGFFRITYVRNTGGIFGSFHSLGEPWHTILLVGVPIAAVVLLVVLILRSSPEDRLSRIGLALILGGAIGNQIDRLRLGFVVDFLDFYVKDFHWYNFNIADSAICVGACALLLDAFRHHRRGRRDEGVAAGG
jgi:signal peptidase II